MSTSTGPACLYLWVLAANDPARRFYESLGGNPLIDRIRDADVDGIGVPELPYVWEKLPIVTVGDRAN